MMNTPLILIGITLVIILIWAVSTYNTIVARKNNVKRTWADVLVYERKKNNVLPKIEEWLNQYKDVETSLLEKVTELRTAVQGLSEKETTQKELKQVEALSKKVTSGINVAVEAYPELKSSNLYSQVMREFSELQDNVAASLAIFNSSVEKFNTTIASFPGSVINSVFNKEKEVDVFTDVTAENEFDYTPNI